MKKRIRMMVINNQSQKDNVLSSSNIWYLCGTESKLGLWLKRQQFRKVTNSMDYCRKQKIPFFKSSLLVVWLEVKSFREVVSLSLMKLTARKVKALGSSKLRITLTLLQPNKYLKPMKLYISLNGFSQKM